MQGERTRLPESKCELWKQDFNQDPKGGARENREAVASQEIFRIVHRLKF